MCGQRCFTVQRLMEVEVQSLAGGDAAIEHVVQERVVLEVDLDARGLDRLHHQPFRAPAVPGGADLLTSNRVIASVR